MPSEGATELRIAVDEHGIPHDVKVVKSCGQAMLDVRAVKVIKSYRFKPAQKDGVPVRVQVFLMVKFRDH